MKTVANVSPSPGHALRCVIYARVSSEGQAENYSLPTQIDRCAAHAAERGWSVIAVEQEQHSGADLHGREGLQRALALIENGGADVLLALASDRLSREQLHIGVILDRVLRAGASMQFASEDFEATPVGKFLLSARTFAAELELAKIGERTQRGRRARVASGKPIPGSHPPFGYRWVDAEKTRLTLNPETAPLVRGMFQQALSGASLRSIAADLDARGIPTPYGRGFWSAQTVRRILMRETYSTGHRTAFAIRFERQADGRYRERPGRDDERMVIADVAPTIVTPEEQAAVISRLAMNRQFSPRNNKHPEDALLRAGFVRCAHCGWAMRVHHRDSTGQSPRYCCSCYRRGGCPRPVITATILDHAVWEKLTDILRHPQIIAAEVSQHRERGGLEHDLAGVTARLTGIASKQERIVKAIGSIADDAAAEPLYEELKTLAASKIAAEKERDELHQRIIDQEAEDARVRSLGAWCETVAANLDTLTYEEKRVALDALGVEVRVWREGAADADGNPLPRWEMTIDPASPAATIVSPTACSRCEVLRRRERRCTSAAPLPRLRFTAAKPTGQPEP